MILITYFEKFVSNIQPSTERVRAISNAHNTLRKHLKEDAELLFPVSDSFLTGSYARSTAIDPVKDADIVLVLEENEVSDDRKTPNPRRILEDLKAAIDNFYDKVNLETQRRSIQVFLEEDDVRMDIVPSIAPRGKDKQLFVPDYEQSKWIDSDPSSHISYARDLNKGTNGQFVRAAKALKWWKEKKLAKSKAPKSFLLETIVGHCIDDKSTNLCEAFAQLLKNILKRYRGNRDAGTLPTVLDPGIPENNLAESCGWNVEDFVYFYDEISSLSQVAELANDSATSKEDTVKLWQSVFGSVYPGSMTDEEERSARYFSTQPSPPERRVFPYEVEISASLYREDAQKRKLEIGRYQNDGPKLAKKMWLKFTIEKIDVPEPYSIRWTVINHGKEARDSEDIRHSNVDGTEHWEHTLYRGHHYMDCEILKDSSVVARNRFIVNVQ